MRELPVPEPGAGELLLKLEACGVCHTDLHVRQGQEPIAEDALPLTLGHEGIGRLVAAGPHSTGRFERGARLGLPWIHDTCLACRECLTGFESFCQDCRAHGYHVNGAFAEYAVIKEAFAVAVPEVLDPVAAAPLLCAGVTAQGAVRKAELGPGKLCAVFGCGGLGQYGIQLAKLAGTSVAAIDSEPAKLEEARRLGADHAFLASEDPGKLLKRLGGADACLNFAPSASVWPAITEAIKPRGWIVSVAMVAEPVPLSLEWLTFNGVRITGTAVGGRQELQDVLALAVQHPLQVAIEAISLEEVEVALDRLAEGKITGRSVIDFRHR
jgi:propanol-preferring alcohol dehydrogenase